MSPAESRLAAAATRRSACQRGRTRGVAENYDVLPERRQALAQAGGDGVVHGELVRQRQRVVLVEDDAPVATRCQAVPPQRRDAWHVEMRQRQLGPALQHVRAVHGDVLLALCCERHCDMLWGCIPRYAGCCAHGQQRVQRRALCNAAAEVRGATVKVAVGAHPCRHLPEELQARRVDELAAVVRIIRLRQHTMRLVASALRRGTLTRAGKREVARLPCQRHVHALANLKSQRTPRQQC